MKKISFSNSRTLSYRQFPYDIRPIAQNLYVPWAIDISSEGNLYFTERSGSIRVIEYGALRSEPLITLPPPFISTGEGGLMGIALDPNFTQNHYLYVMHSYTQNNQIYNRVMRLLEISNRASIDRIILDQIPGGRIHNGGRIKIGPDQKLYVTTGDAGNPMLAQDIQSTAGKILRIALDGSIPIDNPFPSSPVYSLGHRNPQGLTWNFQNTLYACEHGPSAHDEINIIYPGANYGWPLVQGDETAPNVIVQRPLIHSGQNTWAPSGLVFIKHGPWQGNLLVACLRGEQLLALLLNPDGTLVTRMEVRLKNEYGRLREIIEGPDGSLYLTTNNRDGRGTTNIADDQILQLIPRLV
ncbi:MAG: PQQ-dependent sugar dehydrogenase [Candidatus Niameybacter stercoravium]|nr:PQQ-dependent sugar dehydrogenase [Candidatus Niameybacter stercoravium]